jgi:hypothetical protein
MNAYAGFIDKIRIHNLFGFFLQTVSTKNRTNTHFCAPYANLEQKCSDNLLIFSKHVLGAIMKDTNFPETHIV